jgi:hypothetical protein
MMATGSAEYPGEVRMFELYACGTRSGVCSLHWGPVLLAPFSAGTRCRVVFRLGLEQGFGHLAACSIDRRIWLLRLVAACLGTRAECVFLVSALPPRPLAQCGSKCWGLPVATAYTRCMRLRCVPCRKVQQLWMWAATSYADSHLNHRSGPHGLSDAPGVAALRGLCAPCCCCKGKRAHPRAALVFSMAVKPVPSKCFLRTAACC